MITGEQLVAAERKRQVEGEGWTHEHDDEQGGRVLWDAAKCYEVGRLGAFHVSRSTTGLAGVAEVPQWPWAVAAFKPRSEPENLIRAGALYVAAAECFRRTGDDRPHSRWTPACNETVSDYVGWVHWLADLCEGSARNIEALLDQWLSFVAKLLDPAATLDDRLSRYLAERQHVLSTEHLTGAGRVVAQAEYVEGEAGELVDAAKWLQRAGSLAEFGDALREVRHEIADTVLSSTVTARTLGVTVEDCIAEKTLADKGRG